MSHADSDDSEFEAYHFYLRQLRQALKREDLSKETRKNAIHLINAYEFCQINDDEFVEMANDLINQMKVKPKQEPEHDYEDYYSLQELEKQRQNMEEQLHKDEQAKNDLVEFWEEKVTKGSRIHMFWTKGYFFTKGDPDGPVTNYPKPDKRRLWERPPTRRRQAQRRKKLTLETEQVQE